MPSIAAIMAHPDDIEIHVGGTLALLRERGWDVHFVTVCRGDLGSMTYTREQIAMTRAIEARAAADLLGATYENLDVGDLRVSYTPELKTKIVQSLRRLRPDVVVTHARADYMADHENTAVLVREACFASTMPNWETNRPDLEPLPAIPELLHADPTGQIDADGRVVDAAFVVDVGSTIELKARLLACHASQRDWLRVQHGEDDYLNSMRDWARMRGRPAGFEYGEGFTPHRGHAFPRTERLREALSGLVAG